MACAGHVSWPFRSRARRKNRTRLTTSLPSPPQAPKPLGPTAQPFAAVRRPAGVRPVQPLQDEARKTLLRTHTTAVSVRPSRFRRSRRPRGTKSPSPKEEMVYTRNGLYKSKIEPVKAKTFWTSLTCFFMFFWVLRYDAITNSSKKRSLTEKRMKRGSFLFVSRLELYIGRHRRAPRPPLRRLPSFAALRAGKSLVPFGTRASVGRTE